MTKEFFKEYCKHIISEVLCGVPNGEELRVYRDSEDKGDYTKEYFSIECCGFKYIHYGHGREAIEAPEGLDNDLN